MPFHLVMRLSGYWDPPGLAIQDLAAETLMVLSAELWCTWQAIGALAV